MDKSWIDRYFEGDLSPDEEQALLEKVAQDPELRQEWEYQQAVKKAVHQKEREELKSFLQGAEARRGRGKILLWAGAAASVILLTGIGFYFLRDNSTALAQAYFHPLPNMVSPVVRSADPDTGEVLGAFRAYEEENYADAVSEFKKLGEKPYAALYEGISYLALDSTVAAQRTLSRFSATDAELPLETYRKWYLGIACLKNGEKEKAKALFRELAADDNPVREKAAELLDKIR